MSDLANTFMHEEFTAQAVSPEQMDTYLAHGWRHFGTHFFRYNLAFYGDEIRQVMPLRVRLSDFVPSRSQRRVLRKNSDLRCEIRPIRITPEVLYLFDRHKDRFKLHPPESLYDFLSREPACVPCVALELNVYDRDKLLAASFFDIGATALSGIYASFDPEASSRRLGIFTMLKEIEFGRENAKEFYYQGYCYSGESFYDYKKNFRATEKFNWNGSWESADFKP